MAARQIARARAWGALIGFVLVYWLSRRAGLPFPESGGRALIGGFVCRLLAWAAVVTVWRQLIPAQIAAARRRRQHAARVTPRRARRPGRGPPAAGRARRCPSSARRARASAIRERDPNAPQAQSPQAKDEPPSDGHIDVRA